MERLKKEAKLSRGLLREVALKINEGDYRRGHDIGYCLGSAHAYEKMIKIIEKGVK